MADKQEGNISSNPKQAYIGLSFNSIPSQVRQGMLSWATNAQVEGGNENQTTYQNEYANLYCANFPEGYKIIGFHNIVEDDYVVYWLANPDTEDSEIGTVKNCIYTTKVNAKCLALSVDFPVLESVHRKTNCGTEIYWVEGKNRTRYINLDAIPYKEIPGVNDCAATITTEVDCNQLNLQPDFKIPQVDAISVESDGELTAGVYQFSAQYANALSEPYTSFYSITNPVPIFDPLKITQDFNYRVGKSINIRITNIDTTGVYEYINIAVIKTINNIPTPELVGTFQITGDTLNISYTGQSKTDIQLDINEVFQKYNIYTKASGLTVAQDVLIPYGLTSQERISFQKIFNQVNVQWQTWRVPDSRAYSLPTTTTYLKGYMRDEIYPLEGVLLFTNGYQTDGFHIPGRIATAEDIAVVFNDDVVNESLDDCAPDREPLPAWQVYNTGCLLGYEQVYTDYTNGITIPCFKCPPVVETNPTKVGCYTGPYQYGCMAYWESTETYPCNEEVWGDLAGRPIRHHRFPDSLITHIHDNQGYVYPIGFKINLEEILNLIKTSTDLSEEKKANIQGIKIVRGNRANNKSVVAKGLIHNVGKADSVLNTEQTYFYPNYPFNDLASDKFLSYTQTNNDSGLNAGDRIQGFVSDESKKRFVFHSPDTHFYQPTLGTILKLETAEYGKSKGTFVEVKKHSRYKFLSTASYVLALAVGAFAAFAPNSVGVVVSTPGVAAGFATYNLVLEIIEKLIPRLNYTVQFNSVGEYTDFIAVPNSGNKQRGVDLGVYLTPGMQSVGDTFIVNNYQRESSVYLRTTLPLMYPSQIPLVPVDNSRYLLSEQSPANQLGIVSERDISSYYSSVKKHFKNQYGQIFSYESIDTGYQFLIDVSQPLDNTTVSVFGGDVFINRFAYKSKFPLFIDNRVGFSDEADIEYDEIPNLAHPIFWFSTSREATGSGGFIPGISQLFGVAQNNFDAPPGGGSKFFYQTGKIYLFVYGIPYFYVESEVNVDYRQAYNDKEGDFFPRVGSGIPNDWLQEIQTTIQQDNTYIYNRTYSKQNKENFFSHLPPDFTENECTTIFPFRAVFSEPKTDSPNPSLRNNWRIFKPSSRYDFPQNFGNLISLTGIENKQVLARFENKAQLYNALLTMPTSVGQAYLGQSLFSSTVPPLDYADTDLGYIGCQNKFILKTEFGDITADTKRGQIFSIAGQSVKELTQDTETQQCSKFFSEFLPFQIQKAFPSYPIDNHFKGVGLHGVYDAKYNRLIITKLDYKPNITGITYEGGQLMYAGNIIELSNTTYFCNQSFTISYDFENQAWISMHTYLPNFYVGNNSTFFAGKNDDISSVWIHNATLTKFNSFFGEIHPYTIEYPYSFGYLDQILQNIKDYSKVLQYTDFQEFIETDDYYFSEVIIYSGQQSSGKLRPVKKPQNNLKAYSEFPKYFPDYKEITFTKSGSFYNINTFWDVIISAKKPVWKASCENLSIFKELNQENHSYGKKSRSKSPMRSKDLKIRLTLDNRDDIKILSTFTVAPTVNSFK